MIRIIGFFLVFGSGGLWGELLLARQRKQIRDIQTGKRLIQLLIWELGQHPEKMADLPGRLAVQGEWEGYLGERMGYLDQLKVPGTLPKGVRECLEGCFKRLGNQEAAASLQDLEDANHWLEELEKERRQTLERDGRLYRPVGLCCGLALAIFLL